MRRGRQAIAAAALLCLPSIALAKEKKPADETSVTAGVKEAEKYAAEAYEAYQAQDYSTAVALYLKALDASPSADIVYNVAKLYDTKLKDRQLAMTFYRRYIADPGAEPDRIKTVNERLAELREAELAAETPAESSRTGKQPTRGSSAPAGAGAPAEPPRDDGLSAVQVTGIVVGVVGLVGVGLGAGFGVAAMSDANTANDDCNGDLCQTQEGVDAAESASTSALISTIGFVGGGSLIVAGTLLAVFGGSSSATAGDSVSLQVHPVVGPYGSSLQLTGRW